MVGQSDTGEEDDSLAEVALVVGHLGRGRPTMNSSVVSNGNPVLLQMYSSAMDNYYILLWYLTLKIFNCLPEPVHLYGFTADLTDSLEEVGVVVTEVFLTGRAGVEVRL